jgi:hypothetical protein
MAKWRAIGYWPLLAVNFWKGARGVCGGNNWQRPWWQIYKKQEDEEVKNPHPSNSIQQVQKGMIIARDVKIVKCNNTFWTYWIQHFFYDRTKKTFYSTRSCVYWAFFSTCGPLKRSCHLRFKLAHYFFHYYTEGDEELLYLLLL